jgi:hypothetical protein
LCYLHLSALSHGSHEQHILDTHTTYWAGEGFITK